MPGPLRSQGLKAIALPGRAVIQRLALLGNVLDVEALLFKVEQAMAGQPASAPQFRDNFLSISAGASTLNVRQKTS